jgi:hypothetical protein
VTQIRTGMLTGKKQARDYVPNLLLSVELPGIERATEIGVTRVNAEFDDAKRRERT